MIVGNYKINVLETGNFALDGGAMFGIIPKPLWGKRYPFDDLNRIKLSAKCLLLQSEEKNILVDTGMGDSWDSKSQKIYDIDNSENNLQKSLKNYNLLFDDITDVILTHLHFDHTGGAVKCENDVWKPAFPNAKYFIQKKHFDWAVNPNDRDRGSFIKHRFMPLVDNDVLSFIDGNQKFDENIELLPIDGHTKSQQLVKISDGKKTVVYCGDLIPTSAHIPIPYVMGYDLFPTISVNEKKELLKKSSENGWILIFEHDAYNDAAEIELTDKGYAVKNFIKL